MQEADVTKGEVDKDFLGKFLCISCHKLFKRPASGLVIRRCPHCARETVYMVSHRFRAPALRNTKAWKVVTYLLKNGFNYNRVYIPVESQKGAYRSIEYPKDMRSALEFVKKYKKYSPGLPVENQFEFRTSR